MAADDPYAEFRAPPPAAAEDQWATFRNPPTQPEKPGGKVAAIGSGLVSGAEGLAAAPHAITGIGNWLARLPGYAVGMTDEQLDKNLATTQAARAAPYLDPGTATGAAASFVKKNVDLATGGIANYEPQTAAERYLKTGAEMVPGVLLPGAGSIAQRAGAVVGSGIGSQAASDLLPEQYKGGKLEGVARFVGAILGGGLANAQRIGGTAEKIAQEGLKGTDPNDIVKAAGLVKDAADQGINLSWPQAIDQVKGAPGRLSEIQRMVEQSRGGSPVMKEFYAGQPEAVSAAAEKQMAQVAPQTLDPVAGGARIKEAATGAIQDVTDRINAAAGPFYSASEKQPLPRAVYARISADPSYKEALKELRSDSILKSQFAHLPDNSIGIVDQVTKRQNVMANKAMSSESGVDRFKAQLIGDASQEARDAARAVSSEYDTALTMQAQGRKDFLNPMEAGPVGQIAGTAEPTGALFENAPPSGSAAVVGKAVKDLAAKDPEAATSIVGQHIRTVFSEATQKLQSGENQFGGAKFASQLMGNPEQAAVLEQAVKALPGGTVRWDGWNKFMNILEATGKRLQPGSPTEPNRMITEQLGKGGSVLGTAMDVATGGFHLASRIREAHRYFQTGQNAEKLAKIFTDPSAAGMLGRLVRLAPGSSAAQAFALRLSLIAAPELARPFGQ